MNRGLIEAVKVVDRVVSDGAYLSIAIGGVTEEDKKLAAFLSYGVMDEYYTLSYRLRSMVRKMPTGKILATLLVGLYTLDKSAIPPYAVVNECIDIAKRVSGNKEAGFVNAVLKKAAKGTPDVQLNDKEKLESEFNIPYWLVERLKKEYPKAWKKQLNKESALHVRLRRGVGEEIIKDSIIKRTKTGFFVEQTDEVKDAFDRGLLTYQGLYSTYAVLAMGDIAGLKVLDLCAAPGGKAVYAAERGAFVTACDLYPHRAELIHSYADRMKVRINTEVSDATVFNPEMENAFDVVIADVPCSGLGVLARRKDMILHRDNGDIKNLARIQTKILDNASRYLVSGGTLIYSTCTVTREENRDVVSDFLHKHKDFSRSKIDFLDFDNNGEVQFIKTDRFSDGFFVSRLIKK